MNHELRIKDKIQGSIKEALKSLSIENGEVVLENPVDLSNGDFSTSVALSLAKSSGMNPRELAEKIVAELSKPGLDNVEKIEVAGAGFINFYLKSDFFAKNISEILNKGEKFGESNIHSDQKILIEHSSPNLFKAFHIGHVMNNAIGESITRLAKFSGAQVTVISYPSDVSLGIGKAIWALMKDGGIDKLNTFKGGAEEIAYLGDCYVRGTRAYDDEPEIQPEIRSITSSIYNKTESKEYELYLDAKERNMAYFKSITETLGSHFDDFIFESEAGKEGKEIVEKNIGEVFEKSDGAVIYKGEKDGLHTRVFINTDGYPTYEAKDLGLMSLKFEKFSPDVSIFITDHEQQEYFKVVRSAASHINKTWSDKTIHRTHGRMSFKGEKMSSRLGGVPPAQALLDVLYAELNSRASNLEKETNEKIINNIAVSALKFPILRAQAGKNINFDPETSLSFEGDTGPYLQYTAVRARSVIEKAKSMGLSVNSDYISDWQTTSLEHTLLHFPDVVVRSIEEWEPHHVAGYLLKLAQEFNSWYGNTKIVDADDTTSPYKLAIAEATAQVISNGLCLLGIEVPEKM